MKDNYDALKTTNDALKKQVLRCFCLYRNSYVYSIGHYLISFMHKQVIE